MITCHVRYEIDPAEIDAFERFARAGWTSSSATAARITAISCRPRARATSPTRSSASPAWPDYERYRERFGVDPEFIAADRIRDESGCVRRYERSFMRPLLPR